jgi:Cu+-exporting ATPase
VQRTLERTPGVSSANVNLMTGAATVDFDPRATSTERLVDAIRATGYGAEVPRAGESVEDLLQTQDIVRGEEIADLRRKFALSIVVAVLSMLIGIPLAAHPPGTASDPLMRLMMPLAGWIQRVAPWTAGVSADMWR